MRALCEHLILFATLALVAPPSASAQEPAQAEPREQPGRRARALVEILDARGRAPRTVAPADLEVLEDGRPAKILSVGRSSGTEPGAPGWEVVVYLDEALSRSRSIQRLAEVLARYSGLIASFGELEIVEARPRAQRTLPATRQRELMERVLSELSFEGEGDDALARRRSAYLEERRPDEGLDPELVREAMREEVELLRRQDEELIAWLAERGRSERPRVLVLLNDALGVDPIDFYLGELAETPELAHLGEAAPNVEELAEVLAAYGWIGVPMMIAAPDDERRLRYRPSEELPVGFRLRLGRREAEGEEEEQEGLAELRLQLQPRDRMAALSQATGGVVVSDVEELPEVLSRLARRLEVRFLSRSPLDGATHRLEVRTAEPRLSISAPSLVAGSTPAAVAQMRARRFLEEELEEGELEVSSAVELDPEAGRGATRVRARVVLPRESDPGQAVVGRPLRVTVGVHQTSGELFLRHEVVSDARPTAFGDWYYETSIRVPPTSDAAVVLVEDLASGRWGASLPAFVAGELSLDEPQVSAPPREAEAIRLLPPDSNVQRGEVTLRTEVQAGVERVVFFLDGKKVSERREPPFAAEIDVGPRPRRREVVVVAYAADGVELGRDALVLNDAAERFRVRIVEPRPGMRVGPVGIEAVVDLPEGGVLDRVQFFWREELVATLRRPPFRHRVLIPLSNPGGFIRVAAHLVDGRVVEDVVLMNSAEFGEQVAVELKELYVVVTDRQGRPARGLQLNDFVVRDNGIEQKVETFAKAGDLPLTVGLAIDASSSLFVKLPEVQLAATEFVDSLVAHQDRAFLVGFGTRPWVVRATSGNLHGIVSGIESLDARGRTAVWEAIVLSLLQLQSVDGRKALVVFYDGDDEDERFNYRTCLDLVRKAEVPVYLIVMNDEAARSGGRSFSTRSFVTRLERLASAGGGRVYFVRTDQDLEEIFGAIAEELRSHYLLAYYPDREEGASDWRPVQVEVRRRGLEARTIAGYGSAPARGGR